jgi:hypothetical protein
MKRIMSRMYMSEAVHNKARKFGSATIYFPCWVRSGARWNKALFTHTEIRAAVRRAHENPEDMPGRAPGTLREKVLRLLGFL